MYDVTSVYIYIYIYIYTHTYMYTHLDTQTHTFLPGHWESILLGDKF